jgi:hypothetical protein
MKRITFTALITTLLFSIQTQAQVQRGTTVVEPYYGYSLFSTAILEAYESTSSTNTSYKNFGPVGLRVEYFVSDLIGLGFDVNYKSLELTDDYISGTNTYTQTISSTQIRAMYRMNFHVVRTKMVDYYLGTGLGYKSNKWDFKDTNPTVNSIDYDAIFPIAFRMSTGVRVFFTENIGANFEIGVGGGSFATAGLTFKY